MSPAASSPFTQAPWPATVTDGNGTTVTCSSAKDVGKTVPIIPASLVANHNGNSTLYQKIQGYLSKPISDYGPLGPQDFVSQHVTSDGKPDTDFFSAYYAYLPYIMFADPTTNPYVMPNSGDLNSAAGLSSQVWTSLAQEAQLHQLESQLDQGFVPFDIGSSTGEADARTFLDSYKAMTLNHRSLQYTRAELPFMPGASIPLMRADPAPDSYTLVAVFQKDARHCVDVDETTGKSASPHWESKDEWIDTLVNTYWAQNFWHEFGHAMGLEHNHMGSVDQPNYLPPPTDPATGQARLNADGTTQYALYSSSVMEYNTRPDRVFWNGAWAPYDQGALAWIYANGNTNNPAGKAPSGTTAALGPSGQLSPTYPWNDPNGFDSTGKEHMFLYCNERHMRYTPMCRQGDMGRTPSEITANDIDKYEWQYKFRNFRQYHKFWDDSNYGDIPMNTVTELRRFLSLWSYDMSASELTQEVPADGVNPPSGVVGADLLRPAHQGVRRRDGRGGLARRRIPRGHRPAERRGPPLHDDVRQLLRRRHAAGDHARQARRHPAFTALWPVDNYDQTQAAGHYIASYASFGVHNQVDDTSTGSTTRPRPSRPSCRCWAVRSTRSNTPSRSPSRSSTSTATTRTTCTRVRPPRAPRRCSGRAATSSTACRTSSRSSRTSP